jgi:predicted PurR-regulated permease PerM
LRPLRASAEATLTALFRGWSILDAMSGHIPNDATLAAIAARRHRTVRIVIAPRSMVIALLVAAASWMLIRLAPALMVLLVALMIVGSLSPAVRALQARSIGRRSAILIVFGLLLLLLIGMVTLTVPALIAQVSSLIDQEPALREKLAGFLAGFGPTRFLAEVVRNVHYDTLIKDAAGDVLAMSARFIEIMAYGAGAFFLALYMMFDGDRLRGALYLATPRAHHIRLSRVLHNLETIVGGYIRGQLLTCLMMGVFMCVLLTACGVPNALALSVFGGLADVFPFVGILLTMIPALLATLPQGTVVTLLVLVLMLAYEEFESRVLVPVVYGRALRLPSSVVLFALIAGGTLAGVAGALLALPVAATILMLIDELRMEMPGENPQREDVEIQQQDERDEAEYQRRTEGMPAGEAAAVAVEISQAQKKERDEASPKGSE